MALRKILTQNDPALRKKSREVKNINDHIVTALHDMLETMRDADGVGLAAPQVGMLRRMFVAEPEPGKVYYMINPEILESSGSEEGEEGCLSVPGYVGVVDRPSFIRMKAQDIDGKEKEYTFEGFYARVMCHEYDHLDGILYTDKASEVYLPGSEAAAEYNAGE